MPPVSDIIYPVVCLCADINGSGNRDCDINKGMEAQGTCADGASRCDE